MKKHLRIAACMLACATGMGSVASASTGEKQNVALLKASIRPCQSIGMPSYTARRIVDMGRIVITSRVYVAGMKEREELRRAGQLLVVLRDGKTETSWNPATRKGFRIMMRPPKMPPRDKARPRIRAITLNKDDRILKVVQERFNGRWLEILRITCRKDGVLLGKRFFARLPNGQAVQVKMHQEDIEVKELPDSLFRVPADVTIVERRPPGR